MTVDEVIERLVELKRLHGGFLKVYFINSASGEVIEIDEIFQDDRVSKEYGPFDCEDGQKYIGISGD